MNENPSRKTGSSLLDELAGEAISKLKALQSESQDRQARSEKLNAALKKIYKFLQPFSVHVNNIAPSLPRTYRIDGNVGL